MLCEICGKGFTGIRKTFFLKREVPYVVEKVEVACQQCGKEFSGHSECVESQFVSMQLPERMREGDYKEYKICLDCKRAVDAVKCKICGKSFTFIDKTCWGRVVHKVDQEMQVTCQRCGKEFSGHSECVESQFDSIQLPERMREGDYKEYEMCLDCKKNVAAQIYGQSDLRAGKLAFDKGYDKGYDEGYDEGHDEGYREGKRHRQD
jgi:hypothetical protein